MNRRGFHLLLLVLVVAVSCTKTTPALNIAQAKAAAPFQATVEDIHLTDFGKSGSGLVLWISLRKQDGSKISILQAGASTQDVALAQLLRKGEKYDFPKILLENEQKQ
jgi:hypothetical protein